MGEIGLAGELRRVRDLAQRLAEAARLGFRASSRASPDAPEICVAAGVRQARGVLVPDVARCPRARAPVRYDRPTPSERRGP